MLNLEHKTAVVTGAASGIGRAIAISLAKRGCHLALADIDLAGLAITESMLACASLKVSTHKLDVADQQAVADFPAKVLAVHHGVDILVNNAGVALGGNFVDVKEEDFEWLMNINFWGVVRMTRAFLPVLKSSDEARIVNLSSLFGLIAPAGQCAYCASKFAVRGFSQALRHELLGSNIGVTVVHPGGVATSIAKSARISAPVSKDELAQRMKRVEKQLTMPPAEAGEIIVRAIEHRKARILVGKDAKLLSLLERIMPASYWTLLAPLVNRKS